MDSSLGDAGWGATMRAASGREESESDWMAMVRKRLGTMQRASYRRWPGRARHPWTDPPTRRLPTRAGARARTAARVGLTQFQRAAVGAGDGLGQRQPQAHAAGAGAGVIQAAEGPQCLAAALGRDARPVVGHVQHRVAPPVQADVDRGAPWFSALPIRLSSRRPSATASACTTRAGSSAPCSRMSVPAPCQARTRSPSQSCSAMDAYR